MGHKGQFQKGHKINVGNKNHLGLKHSAEARRKISQNNKGKIAWNKGKSWSEEVKLQISETNKRKNIEPKVKYIGIGENHWNWKEDRTQLKRFNDAAKDRRSYAYIEWRKRVWVRDNWQCKMKNQDCGGRIEAHHILGYTKYPDLRYELNNGITLCKVHHPKKRADEDKLMSVFQELIIKK